MPANTSLPALPFWRARSWWATLIAAALALSSAFGFDLLGAAGAADEAALTDRIMEIVTAAAVIWAWGERRAPNYRLTLS